ncbi:hypothetical protein CYMTET_16976 [Cymbomonas tetramitiformis]|uniref:Uncharacterized protein n=1 Tax=Cymbomonas tetramitiformis TaxID=36881 RepID=A0AAE0BW06_9CHLO|nr:hypothetical protein CYMTET_47246 [Cymbomonas tetramitiformis]KAK3274861.1 hypothetical protein CYMTET_16976 [Cymbomonas tetramitiformis]
MAAPSSVSEQLKLRPRQEVIREFFEHASIRDLQERLLQAHFLSLRYHPCKDMIGSRPIVLELVEHYCEFMYLLCLNKDGSRDWLSPPPIIGMVWHEHVVDTRGYQAFCTEQFGEFVHHNANRALIVNVTLRELSRARTTIEYSKRLGERRIREMIVRGLWWPTRLFEDLPDEKEITEVNAPSEEMSRKRRAGANEQDPSAPKTKCHK